MSGQDQPFFVGYLPVPGPLARFLGVVSAGAVLLALVLGFSVAATQDDPGDGRFRFDLGRQTVTGVLVEGAYPVLRVTEGTEAIPAGRTLMLSGGGKNGIQARAAPLLGRRVTVAGVLLTRGSLQMLQVRGAADGMVAADGAAPALEAAEPLGRWRLTGELCDGKCTAGAMRPGLGLSHKACANLCVIGGVPMVFVSAAPVAGTAYLMVTGPDGGAVPQALLDATADLVEIEGAMERIGDLVVLRADPATLRRP